MNLVDALVVHPIEHWREAENVKEYLKIISSLWKTLEVALNHAELDLDFIIFLCTTIMSKVSSVEGSGMTFAPVLVPSTSRFKAKVRYRAEGRKVSKRYRAPTKQQTQRVYSGRSLLAAQGVVPSSASSRE